MAEVKERAARAAPNRKAARPPAVEAPRAEPAARFPAPRSPAAAADKLYAVRDRRLDLDRSSRELKEEEGFLREYLIETIPMSDATGVTGKLAQAVIKTKVVPQAEDWSKIYAQIVRDYLDHKRRKTGQHDGAFSLINRALNAAAVEERWEAGESVAGVGRFQTKVVSLTRVAP